MNPMIIQMLNQFRTNPQQVLSQMGIPQNANPNDLIQKMMNNGKFTQSQYNWAAQMARQYMEQFKG